MAGPQDEGVPSPVEPTQAEPGADLAERTSAEALELAEPEPEDVAALRSELEQRSEQLLRLAADFENFRRRKNLELGDRARYASEEAARALLPVLDNLRRAIGHAARVDGESPPGPEPAAPRPGEADQQLHDGLRLVVLQFEQALREIGVEPVETVGARFDPALHEAIGGVESDEVSEDTVIDEVQPGYRLHDRLLRPALVRVAHPRRGGSGAG
jgi:molecular chaperone GrpE